MKARAATETLWAGLERMSGPAASAIWQRELGEEFEVFRLAFLQKLSGPAPTFPCDNCGCFHEVIARKREYVAVCRCEPWTCADIPLSATDVELWSLSLTRFGRALCKALGMS